MDYNCTDACGRKPRFYRRRNENDDGYGFICNGKTGGPALGITSKLGILSRMILILLMFLGRVGGLTLIYAALSGPKETMSRLPQEKIMVG